MSEEGKNGNHEKASFCETSKAQHEHQRRNRLKRAEIGRTGKHDTERCKLPNGSAGRDSAELKTVEIA